MPEQRKLAANLDCIEQMMANRREQLVSFDQLVKSRFIELFGDPVSNPKDWDVVPLGKRCGIITGNTPSRSEPEITVSTLSGLNRTISTLLSHSLPKRRNAYLKPVLTNAVLLKRVVF